MNDNKQGANMVVPPPTEKGAMNAGSPPADEVIAELKRKSEEFSSLKGEVSTVKEELVDARSTIADLTAKLEEVGLTKREEQKLTTAKSDARALAKQLRAQAAAGDRDAMAYEAMIEEIFEEKEKALDDKINQRITQSRFEEDFNRQEKFLEHAAREEGVSVKELMGLIDPFSEPYQKRMPSEQAELAVRDYRREKTLRDREAKAKTAEDAAQNFRDGGSQRTGEAAEKKKDWTKDWRSAKSRDEQIQTLYDI